jgi:DNA-binding protein Fis
MNIYQGNRILAAEHLGVTRKTIDRKLNGNRSPEGD